MIVDKIWLTAGAAIGLTAGVVLSSTYFSLFSIPEARREARATAVAEMDQATNRAIGELTDEADKVRVARALCRESGRVYLLGRRECVERAP